MRRDRTVSGDVFSREGVLSAMNFHPKVVAGGVAGAVTVVLVWAVGTFAKVDIPAEVASAITTILSFAASYLFPAGANS